MSDAGTMDRVGNQPASSLVVNREKMTRATQRRGIFLKSAREIELMRAAGRVVHRILERVRETVAPGVTTSQLNTLAETMIAEVGGTPLFKGVENPQARFPFPAALCTSVNEELVHGIPNDRPLAVGPYRSVRWHQKSGGCSM
jgi:methionine aminopeptidase